MESNNSAPVSTEASSTPNTTTESSEGQEENATPQATTTQELKKTLRQLKLKVDKSEVSEDLPFDLPDDPKAIEYMTRQLQMAKMGGKRAQQYSELESEVRDFVELLKTNPKKALSDPSIGLDLKQFAASIIEEEIENSRKSPEQLEKEAISAELAALKKERDKEKEDRKKSDLDARQKQLYTEYETNINKAIKDNGLPQSNYLLKKTAEYMSLAMAEGIDAKAEDVMGLVKKDLSADLKELFDAMNEDSIEEYVGKENLSRVRKRNLARAKEKPQLPGNKIAQDVGAGKPSEKKTENVKKTLREMFDV